MFDLETVISLADGTQATVVQAINVQVLERLALLMDFNNGYVGVFDLETVISLADGT